jgi:hypothetical protein
MMQPNWFDKKHERNLEKATAEQALAEIAKDDRVVKAVKGALTDHDTNAKKPGWAGPSRTQAVRQAIAEVLQEQA